LCIATDLYWAKIRVREPKLKKLTYTLSIQNSSEMAFNKADNGDGILDEGMPGEMSPTDGCVDGCVHHPPPLHTPHAYKRARSVLLLSSITYRRIRKNDGEIETR
jgi:hypothetical protein